MRWQGKGVYLAGISRYVVGKMLKGFNSEAFVGFCGPDVTTSCHLPVLYGAFKRPLGNTCRIGALGSVTYWYVTNQVSHQLFVERCFISCCWVIKWKDTWMLWPFVICYLYSNNIENNKTQCLLFFLISVGARRSIPLVFTLLCLCNASVCQDNLKENSHEAF